MNLRREVVAAVCAVGLAACAAVADDGAGSDTSASSTTIQLSSGVGVLPSMVTSMPPSSMSSVTSTVEPTTTPATTTPALTVPEDPSARVGEVAAGNRVLMIGDSILAAASKRYGNEICQVLVPMGWRVRVEAEVSRFIDFGKVVADEVMDEGWDAGVVFLGTNYNRDANDYFKQLNRLILRFGDVPVVLVTVGERDADLARVNEVIRALGDASANVSVVEWGAAVAADPSLLREDGIHPSDFGRLALAVLIGQRFGSAPTDAGSGRCLDQVFVDDTGGVPGMPTTTTTITTTVPRSTTTAPASTTSSVPRSTTSIPSTTTTVASSTTGPSTTATPTTAPATTPPATTAAPPTSPPSPSG